MAGPEEGVIDRPHVSPWLLWAAMHHARLAKRIEQLRPDGHPHPFLEHRAYVIASLTATASFIESFINEVFQDVVDQADGRMGADFNRTVTAPLSDATRRPMIEYWAKTNAGFSKTLEKYGQLLKCAGTSPLDPAVRADAQLVLDIRNTLLHYRPEDNFRADKALRLEAELTRRKVPPNPLVGPNPRAYWPEHALGSGMAGWAAKSAVALTDTTCLAVGINPAYAIQKQYLWSENPPGTCEAESRIRRP
ncbi:MAG: hypothetical protein ACRDJU_14610 [Actinomycetota bacterium]